jgi:IS5 family transposase
MRATINRQFSLGQSPLDEIALDDDCRFELIPILAGLQHLYGQPERRQRLLDLVAADILGEADPDRGRDGMSFWQVLVLAVVRQGCDYDYAALRHAANHDGLVRAFLQIGPLSDEGFAEKTIHENVSKLRPQTLEQIVYLIAEAGHDLAPQACQKVRSDSFVVQTNIHYPTDTNLLLDGIRKLITLSRRLADEYELPGWRQAKHLYKKAKRLSRRIGRMAKGRGKNRDEQLKTLYGELIDQARRITDRALDLYVATRQAADSLLVGAQREEILRFAVMTDYVASLAERRVLRDETIPHAEKIFSLFEPSTELINRGKRPTPIEFGHRVLVMEDGGGFVVHLEVMGIGVQDVEVLKPAMKAVQDRLNQKIEQASFDRGFWSPENYDALAEMVKLACLPRKGKPLATEGTPEFEQARRQHAGVESKIGALQSGNGLVRCRDRGDVGYARYVMLAAVARNLQTLGKLLLDQSRERRRKRKAG